MSGVGQTRPAEKAKQWGTEEKENTKAKEDSEAKEDSRTRER